MAPRSVQIVPAGSRQVAPGIFQMTRRGARRGGSHHKKHKHHSRGPLPMMSQSFVRYVKLLNTFRGVAQNFTAPPWLNVPALLLYLHGQNKKDKGAMNVAKTMLLDTAAQRNPQIAALLNAGAGDLGMLGLLGGFGGGGFGGFGGGAPGPNQFRTQSAPDTGGGNDIVDTADAATDLINAVDDLNAEEV